MNSKDNFLPYLNFMVCEDLGMCMSLCECLCDCICVCVSVFFVVTSVRILDKGVLHFFQTTVNNQRLYLRTHFNKHLFLCQGKIYILEN